MYSPLPTTSPAPGPQVDSRLARPLRGILKLFNVAVGAGGATLVGAALYMFIVFHRTGLLPPSPTPSPTPSPSPSPASWKSLWFIYFVASYGTALLLTSLSGFSGTRLENRRKLFLHIIMLSLVILLEIVCLLILFVPGNSFRPLIPDDPTGFWLCVQQFIDANIHLVKVVALSVLGAQVVGLGVASWLHSIYQTAYEEWLDGVEAAQVRAMEQLGRAAEQAYAGTGASVLQTRIEGKYGIGSNEWEGAVTTSMAVQRDGLVDKGASGSGIVRFPAAGMSTP